MDSYRSPVAMLPMISDASDFLETQGVDPGGESVTPLTARLLRLELEEDFGAHPVLVSADDPTAPDADQAWQLGDGSLVLRFGSTWAATGINGVDAAGVRWSVEP